MTTAFVCFNWFQTVNNTNKQWNDVAYNASTPVSLVDSANVATGWSVTKPATAQGSGDGAGTVGTGDAAWVDEVGVIGGGWRYDNTSGAITHVISGLDDAKTYTLEFLGSVDLQANRIADVTIGGTTKQIIGSDGAGAPNTTQTAAFTGIAPSAGQISFTVEQGAGSTGGGYLNAWYIQEEAAASDTTPPTISSASVPTAGDKIAVQMSEAMQVGAGGAGGWTISLGDATISSAAVDGVDDTIINLTPSRTLLTGETFTIGYTQPTDGFQDQAATPNDLATLSGQAVTNNSAQSAVTEGLPAYTLNKDGSPVGNLTGVKVRVTATGELNGTELYSVNNATTSAGVLSAIDLSATSAAVGDTVTVEILTGANEGIVFSDLVEDIA